MTTRHEQQRRLQVPFTGAKVGAPLLVAALMAGGCASTMPIASVMPTAPEPGLLARAGDAHWRAEAWAKGAAPVLRVWGPQETTLLLENTTFLPPDLSRAQPEWRVQSMDLQRGQLVVLLRYQPKVGAAAYQDKRFEFDLTAPNHPLVQYRVSTTRGTNVDWQTVDFVTRKSQLCRNAPASNPENCTPTPAILLDEPAPTLATMGNAEEYVPAIKMDTQY
jgi:hypothetical protein